ncbi:hypothetical protein V1514DRAFT_337523 [Lipomyces japonicus]|uniref:uncharacterized protein n=1 Tax=Lipomyces japonicus TaxID=56871 RepID=UPI0034CF9CAF
MIVETAKKRIKTLECLQQTCNRTDVYWANTINFNGLRQDDRQAQSWFMLGIALAEVVDLIAINPGDDDEFAKLVDKVLQRDYGESQLSKSKSSKSKLLFRNSTSRRKQELMTNQVVPFDLALSQLAMSLCDVLIDTYDRLRFTVSESMFAKVDSKMQKLVLEPFIKEFESQGRTGAAQEICRLSSLMLESK